jgi:predicted glycosyltransferase involved in capsule biosynthesis
MRIYYTTEARNSYGLYLKIKLIFHSRDTVSSVMNTKQGMLFRKVLTVYCKHRTKHVQKMCDKNRVLVMLLLVAEC